MWMTWEQTDRVRAETANDSSSKSALGDSIRFPPWGEKGGAHLLVAQVGSKLEVKDDAKKSPGEGPQASSFHRRVL